MKIYIGIDPGMTGAFAILRGDGRVEIYDIRPRKDKRTVDRVSLGFPTGVDDEIYIAIEDINAIPTFGSMSSFKMGRALGVIEASFLDVAHRSFEYVKPTKWKAEFGLNLIACKNPKQKKEAALEYARRLFPQVDLSKAKDHNKADALLIAEYCRRLHR